jgi:hypothetical protein
MLTVIIIGIINDLEFFMPICVLIFKYNRIARSRRASRFGQFVAKCKHTKCTASYKMAIHNEPVQGEDVIVHVLRTGNISIDNEVKSRFVKGNRRAQMKKEIKYKSPFMYRSELLMEVDVEQLNAGNYTAVPSKDVIKQVRTEEHQFEKLNDCVIHEVFAVKL